MARTRVAVVCESTACLPRHLIDQFQIEVVPVPFVFGQTTFHDGVDLEADQFYRRLETEGTIPKTSPPEPGAYLSAWDAARRDGQAVVLVTVANRISTFERSARLAQSLTSQPVVVLDSGSAAMGQGFVALAAARAAAAGHELAAVCAQAQAVAARVNLVVALDTLKYLARTSRIPQIASIVSSILDLKPIIRVRQGQVEPIARVRSRRRSLERLAETITSLSDPQTPLHLAVHHARAREDAQWLLDRLAERRNLAEAFITEFTPVMGAYCGPGLVGAAFYAMHPNDVTGVNDASVSSRSG